MNTVEERLADALRGVGGSIGAEDVPPPRFAERRRTAFRRPALVGAAVAASVAVMAGGAVLAGGISSGRDHDARPLAAPTGGEVRVELDLCTKTTANRSCEGKEVTDHQKRALMTKLKGDRKVRHVEYLSKKDAYVRFKARMLQKKRPATRPGDIPEAILVTVAGGDVRAVMQTYLGHPGVDTIFVEDR